VAQPPTSSWVARATRTRLEAGFALSDKEPDREESRVQGLALSEHYYLDESDPDVLVLRRQDGTFVAAFSAQEATREGIVEAAEQNKTRWWPPRRGATRITAVLIAVGALLFVFRSYYLEPLHHRPWTVLGAATAVAAVVVLIRLGQHYQWTGFGETVQSKPDDQEIQPRKSLWDWLQLFIVPLALAAIGLWFAAQQDAHQQQIEDKRAKSDRHIEEQRAQDAALQAYLDQMSQLMLEGDLLGSKQGSEVRTLARARTRTILVRLDSRRKGSVVQFLYEAGLINKKHPVVSLFDVRLSGADLNGADLSGADLSDAELVDADLSGGADLSDANLIGTDLRKADLVNTTLDGANLGGADLSGADLSGATLIGANLSGGANLGYANLSGADLIEADLSDTYLNRADLSDADLLDANLSVSEEELDDKAKTLEGATMPNGSTHN
jgi:uncharacterized protein YjbI with pentapeptide repeats